jgi:predicted nucleic acid-binding protein
MAKQKVEYVLDSSVVAAIFANEDASAQASKFVKHSVRNKIKLHTLQLLFSEVTNVIVKQEQGTEKMKIDITRLLSLWNTNLIKIHDISKELLHATIDIAEHPRAPQNHISSYDASFHALAIMHGYTLLTLDKKHYNKTKDIIGNIILLSEMEIV